MRLEQVSRPLARLGAWHLTRIGHLSRSAVFLIRTLCCSVTPLIKVNRVLKQIWFIGWKSMLVICLTGGFTGMVLALHGFPTLRRAGSEASLGQSVALLLIRELVPVLAALMVT